MRTKPRLWIGVAIYLIYVAIVAIVQATAGVPFPEIGETAGNLLRSPVLSFAIAGVLLAVTITILGWWRPVLFERERSRRWPIIAPALLAVGAIINLAVADWASFDTTFLLALVLFAVGVGFCEEVVTRGVLITAARPKLHEGWVWFLSTALFAAMHFVNILLGGPALETAGQVGLTFLVGTVLYLVRRTTGSLIWAIVLHGLWDLSLFASADTVSLGVGVGIVAGVAGLVMVPFAFRNRDHASAPQRR